jgi:hypothetical protein
MKFDERFFFFIKIPPFLFPWQLRQSLSYRFRFFLAYLVPQDVDVTGNITAKIGCRCHRNGQNTKKLKSTKIIIAGYSPNRN